MPVTMSVVDSPEGTRENGPPVEPAIAKDVAVFQGDEIIALIKLGIKVVNAEMIHV